MAGRALLFVCASLLLLLSRASHAEETQDVSAAHLPGRKGRSVCIIGAGPSGLASALRLRDKGYSDITVFERDAVPGGKSLTVTVEGGFDLYVGAILGVEGSYINIGKLLKQYGVPPKPFNSTRYAVNYETGTMALVSSLPTNRTAVQEAVMKYIALHKQYEQYIVPGFLKGVPEEILGSFGSWIRANKLEILLPVMYSVLTAYGYGSLELTPTCYVFQFVTPPLMLSALDIVPGTYITDFLQLWKRVAADLNGSGVNFRYNANIVKVLRSPNGKGKSTIRYTTTKPQAEPRHGGGSSSGGRTQIKTCDKIIAALPPNKNNLAAFSLDARERAVFDRVKLVQYYSGLINLPEAQEGRFARILALTGDPTAPSFAIGEPPGDGRPAIHIKWDYTPVAQFWTWVAGDAVMPKDTIVARTVEAMSRYNRQANEPLEAAVPLTPEDIRGLWQWVYFAQFDVRTISNAAFKELEALQGRRGSFFTSSLRSFESQEKVVESAYDIVDRYF